MRRLSCFLSLVALLALTAPTAHAADQPEPAQLVAADAQPTRVEIEVQLTGTISPERGKTDVESSQENGTEELPLELQAKLTYNAYPTTSTDTAQVVRTYDHAEATIRVGNRTWTNQLRSEITSIIAEQTAEQTQPANQLRLRSEQGPLTRDEADLLAVIGDPLTLNGLLPIEAVNEGDSWDISVETLGPLLQLDSVQIGEVTAILTDLTDQHARFRFAGTVLGIAEGAAVENDLRGIGLFNRKTSQLVQVNLAVSTEREVGPATPGLTTTTKITVKTSSVRTDTAHIAKRDLNLTGDHQAADDLLLVSSTKAWHTLHDREWFVVNSDSQSVSLRRIQGESIVAQMTLRQLTPKQADRQPTLESFEKDVRYSLGTQLSKIVATDHWLNTAGHKTMVIVSRGEANGMPVEWRHYLVLPSENGSAISINTTVSPDLASQLGAADRAMVDAITFSNEATAKKATTTVR